MLPSAWLRLGVDTLLDAMPTSLLTSENGIAFGSDGSIRPGPDFGAWKWRGCAGVHIIIDEVFLSGVDARTRWQAALNDVSVLWVGVHCDPAVAAERERGRSGHGHITTQLVHSGMAYDVEVDTSDT